MLNLKSVFVIALLSASATVSADEITIDTTGLEATLTANLAESMELMQTQLTTELNTMLVADEQKQEDKETASIQLAD
ncbi:hypothetical protein CXF83_07730 [Shewanella sp. Choline-02u-19]|jgi:hypothetical protein|uniref:hypothetical protein n=1 Tax=unclassified Shewanella TaxID=196818 RepID=UPI000C32BDBC|nr:MULTISPECIES: hypothetical protein [unclassified Shewanella]PKG58298.1 hypothetical protein CXF82_05090 [Shewanella sp. GutDb-MelDb]PKG75043.1 hypothetical protein CXF86_08600 [Shewanella sp. GutCb]PKH54866.1 hypothetical protein CXF84_18710 [Shewanella sp. Bg11-22]PKI26638.1 hypothetical protein CXF83_07730 [Shewanella sp. Choline-02u-19]